MTQSQRSVKLAPDVEEIPPSPPHVDNSPTHPMAPMDDVPAMEMTCPHPMAPMEESSVTLPHSISGDADQMRRELRKSADPDVGHQDSNATGAKEKKMRATSLFEFANTDAIKEKVRQAKVKKSAYNVFNAYHTTGIVQRIAKHPRFENTTLAVIVINAFWISVDTDGNTAATMLDAKPMYIVMDTAFFVYFSLEVIVRFCAFKRKCDCLKDGWFKFDMTLVMLYAFDPFAIALVAFAQGGGGLNLPTAVLRLFRLARLSRLVRMLRSLPELMVMIKGMVTATSSVGYTMGLLLILTYVFSIAMRNLVPAACDEADGCTCSVKDEACIQSFCEEKFPDVGCIEVVYFQSVPEAMHNLIIFGTFLDALSDFVWAIKAQSAACLMLTWVYIALASLTVMNMLIGVLCEVISAVAQEENETAMVDKVHEQFDAILSELDDNHDGTISWDEFKAILDFPASLQAMEMMNVNPESMIDVAEDLFWEDGEPLTVTFDDFMVMVLDLRGGQQATVENLMSLGKRISQKFMKLQKRTDKIEFKVDSVQEGMDDLNGKMDDLTGKMDQILRHLKVNPAVLR